MATAKNDKLQALVDSVYLNFPCSGDSQTVISDLKNSGFTDKEIVHALEGIEWGKL